MLVKIVTFFLIGMMVLAMFGRLRVPGVGKVALQKPKRCKKCKRFLFNNDPCPCEGGERKR